MACLCLIVYYNDSIILYSEFLYNLIKPIPLHIELFHSCVCSLSTGTPLHTLSSEFCFIEWQRLSSFILALLFCDSDTLTLTLEYCLSFKFCQRCKYSQHKPSLRSISIDLFFQANQTYTFIGIETRL